MRSVASRVHTHASVCTHTHARTHAGRTAGRKGRPAVLHSFSHLRYHGPLLRPAVRPARGRPLSAQARARPDSRRFSFESAALAETRFESSVRILLNSCRAYVIWHSTDLSGDSDDDEEVQTKDKGLHRHPGANKLRLTTGNSRGLSKQSAPSSNTAGRAGEVRRRCRPSAGNGHPAPSIGERAHKADGGRKSDPREWHSNQTNGRFARPSLTDA